jgi:16S rRNA (uracil1498-N3)-methyltransferase
MEISNEDIIHKVKNILRLRTGERIFLFNGVGQEFVYEITAIRKESISVAAMGLAQSQDIPLPPITLGFPVLKEEKIDFILQKATELGVSSFIPFICERSITEAPSEKKYTRWQKIIVEAARQSQRLWSPELKETVDFETVLKTGCRLKFFGQQGEGNVKEIFRQDYGDIILLIGPEGDFSKEEVDQLQANSFKPVNLSVNTLRVETAAVFGIGLINYFLHYES